MRSRWIFAVTQSLSLGGGWLLWYLLRETGKPVRAMRLWEAFEARETGRPRRIALAADDGSTAVAYGLLLERARGLAADLAARGVAQGDRVALFLSNRPEVAVAHLALLRLGAVAVPINTGYRPSEIAPLLADAAPRLVLTGTGRLETLREALAPDRGRVGAVVPVEELGIEELPARAPGTLPPPPGGSHPALLIYTSGTTGRSKGAVLTHDNLWATVAGLLAAWAWSPGDVLLLSLPLFHVHGLVVGLFTAFAAGARVELRRRFDAAAAARELAGGRPGGAPPTVFFGVPTMYARLLPELRRLEPRPSFSGMRLFASGSAPLAPETFRAFQELTGHEILERYGMSEAGMILSNPYAGPRRPGTVGTPLPRVSVRIVEPETGQDVAPGGDGEILVTGPNVFAGYRNDPRKTAASFVPDAGGRRWFRTGDLARRDPATGHVTLLGRRHELLIRGGYNVYPREVEDVLEAHPKVREAAVAGRPDPEWGEVPVAWVVAAADPPDPEALLAWCRERLAPFKVPAKVRLVDELPRNALGKLQKHRLGG